MISIIITYYTGLNILCSNLSLLLQTNLSDVEIIIVNDNPKASVIFLKSYQGFNKMISAYNIFVIIGCITFTYYF